MRIGSAVISARKLAASPGAGALVWAVWLIGWIGVLAVYWPGFVDYDSTVMRHQVLTGRVNDWHPPILIRLWRLVAPDGSPGFLFVLGIVGYAIGITLLAAALDRRGRRGTMLAVLAWGAMPMLVGWQVSVGKDSQFVMALIAAIGLASWWRVRERPLPLSAIVAAGVLLGYASLLRANAPFAVVPLAVLLTDWRWPRRLAVGIAALAMLLAVTPAINTGLFGASRSLVYRSLPIYDIAGIIASGADPAGIMPAERDAIRARRCYMPIYWDPLYFAPRCGVPLERLYLLPKSELFGIWIKAVARHPFAYASHRLAHANQELRLVVGFRPMGPPERNWLYCPDPPHWESCRSPTIEPGHTARRLQQVLGWTTAIPLAWPAILLAAAILSLIALRGVADSPLRTIARSLLGSVACLELGLVFVGIASEFRYHLWTLLAGGLGTILTLSIRRKPGVPVSSLCAIAILIAAGMWGRLSQPALTATLSDLLR